MVKLAAPLALALFVAGCAAGPRAGERTLLASAVTEPAWPSVAACLAATRAASPGSGGGNYGCVRIDVENALSPSFVLQALVIEVDGARVYAREEPAHERGELDLVSTFTVGLGQMAPGPHEVRMGASLVPNAIVAPALGGYRWLRCARHVFTVALGGGLNVTAGLYEDRGEGRPPQEWPAAHYLENGVEVPAPWEPVGGPHDSGCPRVPVR